MLAWALPALDHCNLFCILIKTYFSLVKPGVCSLVWMGMCEHSKRDAGLAGEQGKRAEYRSCSRAASWGLACPGTSNGESRESGTSCGMVCPRTVACVCVYVRVHIPSVVFNPDQPSGRRKNLSGSSGRWGDQTAQKKAIVSTAGQIWSFVEIPKIFKFVTPLKTGIFLFKGLMLFLLLALECPVGTQVCHKIHGLH